MTGQALLQLHHEIANAASQLRHSAEFADLGAQIARHLQEGGLGFTSMCVYLIDPEQDTGRNYYLYPGPAGWVDQAFTVDMAPLVVHREQQARMWQNPHSENPLWFLVAPTALGAVEIASHRPEAFSPEEQELLSYLAPSLQLLAIRHRDLERLEDLGVLTTGAELPPGQPVFRQRQDEPDLFGEIVAQSPAMRQVVQLARLATTTNNTVLILGESGTGKDLLAHAIHAHSQRRTGPLIVVNSASLSSGLEDSELFGHVKGAFTHAIRENTGLVAAAHGGTLFLDEIGDLSPSSQAKLLRTLESGEIRRVGDTRVHKVDIRFIAATNRDLRRAAQEGTFREDLFYRLAVITIAISPLRERPEDIPWLICKFLGRIAREMGRERCEIAPAALEVLVQAPWPGNARQLDSCLRHAALLARGGAIEAEHLPEELLQTPETAPTTAHRSLSDLERHHILQVLEQCGRDRQKAQHLLGISRATLQRRLKEYGLTS